MSDALNIDYDALGTAQDWIDAALAVTKAAREAARSGDKGQMRAAADACSEFIDKRTLDCPKELAHTIADVKIELSQLIVAADVGSVRSRSAQFDAYLQDLEQISAANEGAADSISFKSAKSVVAEATGVIKDLKALKKQVGAADPAAGQKIQELADRLVKMQDAFQALANA